MNKRIRFTISIMILAIGLFSMQTASVQADVYTLNWDLVDSGKHLDYDGDSKYMSYITKGANTWNSYKSDVIRKDSGTVIEDVYASDINVENGARGETYPDGRIYLNKKYLDASTETAARIQKTCTHELGHALGLDHSTMNDVMYKSASNRTALGTNDKESYEDAYENY